MSSKSKASGATGALRTTGQTFNYTNTNKASCHNQDLCTCSSCVCEFVDYDIELELMTLDYMEEHDQRISESYSEGGYYEY